MRNYFKVFVTLKSNDPAGADSAYRQRIGAHEVFPFEDSDPKATAEAFGAACALQTVVGGLISVWRHPRCSRAWDDVRLIGESPILKSDVALRVLENDPPSAVAAREPRGLAEWNAKNGVSG